MRAVDGLDLRQENAQQEPPDSLSVWLDQAASGSRRGGTTHAANGVFADAAASLALAFNAAIQVWQDFDDTAPLHPPSGSGEHIADWLGTVRCARLSAVSQRVRAAVAQLQQSYRLPVPAHGNDASAPAQDDGNIGVGFAAAQARLSAGASPGDAARAAISRLTARLVQARTLANGASERN